MASSSSFSGSGSSSGGVVGDESGSGSQLSGTIRIGAVDGSSCSYYNATDGSACRQPRTCYDCLNVDVADVADGCVLSASGFCEEMSSYNYLADYRRNLTDAELRSSGWYNFFPAANSSYCEAADPACKLCDELVSNGSSVYSMAWDDSNTSVEIYRQYCLGTDGCVCIMACESSDWEDNMMADCSNPASAVDDEDVSSSSYSTLLPLFFLLQVLLLGAFIYRRMLLSRLMRAGPRPQAAGPYNNVNAISSPSNRLRLSGWRKLQSDQIERERKNGLFNLRSPHGDASATAADGNRTLDYEAGPLSREVSPANFPIGETASGTEAIPESSPALTPVLIEGTQDDDRNSIAVLEERPGSSFDAEQQRRVSRTSV